MTSLPEYTTLESVVLFAQILTEYKAIAGA